MRSTLRVTAPKPVVAVMLGAGNGPLRPGSRDPVVRLPRARPRSCWAGSPSTPTGVGPSSTSRPIGESDSDPADQIAVDAGDLARRTSHRPDVGRRVPPGTGSGVARVATASRWQRGGWCRQDRDAGRRGGGLSHRHQSRTPPGRPHAAAGVALDLLDAADVEAAIATMRADSATTPVGSTCNGWRHQVSTFESASARIPASGP